MDTDNTQATRCPALRLYVVHVVLSFFISLLLSVLQKPCYLFFFPSFSIASSKLSRALESKLIRHSGPKQRENWFLITWPNQAVFFSFFWTVLLITEKALAFKKRDKDLCLLPKKKDEQGSVQSTLPRKRGLPLPMIKATIHPSIPETVLVSSYCLRIILHRAACTF